MQRSIAGAGAAVTTSFVMWPFASVIESTREAGGPLDMNISAFMKYRRQQTSKKHPAIRT